MIKTRLILLVCVLAAFGAGVSVGVLWQKSAPVSQDRFLAELNLTPEQRAKIKTIWAAAMKNSGWQTQRERREAAQKEFQAALEGLITVEQKPRYDEIIKAHQIKMDEIAQESTKARNEAYEKTKAELTEPQQVAYEELRKKRMGNHEHPGN